MLHPGPLAAAGAVDVTVEAGAPPAIDLAAAAADGEHAFLRAAWYAAAAGDGPLQTLVARRAGTGDILAAMPLVPRRFGPLAIREVPGSYWPFRSFPVAADASCDELAALLAAPPARAALGQAWRVGPVHADDPTARRLAAAAPASGWTLLARRLATCHVVDLARLTAEGTWPSNKRRQKNRWLLRQLTRHGEPTFWECRGDRWTSEAFDTLAAVEAESWVGREAEPRDTKFLHPANRRMWQRAVADPRLAGRLGCMLLRAGETPAAFVLTLDAGDVRHIVANSYSERFAEASPGLVLLYRAFEAAIAEGFALISWGAGDAGYKGRMGARPGPEIVDLLLVRGPLAPLARLAWRSR